MKTVEVKFGIGDIVCPVHQAEKGNANRAEIRGITIHEDGTKTYYADDGNWHYEENLVSEAEAFNLAASFHEEQARMLRECADEKTRIVCPK